MRMTCKIVTDFAELYLAGLVSEETARAIHTHLGGCPNCRKYYQAYQKMLKHNAKTTIRIEPDDISEAEERSYLNLSQKLRRRRFWEIVGTSAAIGAGSVMLTVGLMLTHRGNQNES